MSEQNDRIKEAAEKGWNEFVKTEHAKDVWLEKDSIVKFKDLDDLHKAGLFAMVTAIVADPYAEPYASLMPANHQRKAYRALDDSLRDALGVARYAHG